MNNIMPESLVGILGLLIWLSSKIIYIFFEIIIIENVLYKRSKIVESNIWELFKKSYKKNKIEINATIFHTFLSAFTFLVIIVICTHYITPEACNYICDHVFLILSFDLIITISILLILNYFI